LVRDPENPDIIYASGDYWNGTNSVMSVAKTVNSGNSWSYFNINEFDGCIYSMAIHPIITDIIFVGGYCNRETEYYGEVFKSINGGSDWTDVNGSSFSFQNSVETLAINPASPDHLLAGCYDGLYESSDGGINWSKISMNFLYISDIVAMDTYILDMCIKVRAFLYPVE